MNMDSTKTVAGESYAGARTGLRKPAPPLLCMERGCERFNRLPKSVTLPDPEVVALEEAALHLDLSLHYVHAVAPQKRGLVAAGEVGQYTAAHSHGLAAHLSRGAQS